MKLHYGSDRIALGNNELRHARTKHDTDNTRLKSDEGILFPALTGSNTALADGLVILFETNIAAQAPNFTTSEGSRSIAINFIGLPAGYGSRLEETLGVPSPITQVVVGPDKYGPGARFKTVYPLSPTKAFELPEFKPPKPD